MARYCAEIGVRDRETLEKQGYMHVYLTLKENHPKIMNRMALYALYGALYDINCLHIPAEIKEKLEEELQQALAKKPQNKALSPTILKNLP